MTYNGWTNYETWNVPLWVDNDEATYRARLIFFDANPVTAANVESFVRTLFPNGTPDFVEAGAAQFAAVNWQEIADHWKEE